MTMVASSGAMSRLLQVLIDDVKEVAWSNRDIAPELATIVIDTIRTAERGYRPELPD